MSALAGIRTELAEALAGVNATIYDYLPEMIAAPAVVILPGDPYIASGEQPFGYFEGRYTLVAIANVAPNREATKALDLLIEAVVAAVVAEGYGLEQVAAPYAFESGGAVHLAADITITTTFTF